MKTNKQTNKFTLVASIFCLLFLVSVIYSCKKQEGENSDVLNAQQAGNSISVILDKFNAGLITQSYSGSARSFVDRLISNNLSKYHPDKKVISRILNKLDSAGCSKLKQRRYSKMKLRTVAFEDEMPADLSEAFEAMDDVVALAKDYVSSAAFYHIEALMNKIENDALAYESTNSSSDLTSQNLADFKEILNNALTEAENNVNNDFSINSIEKSTILGNLLLMKNVLVSNNFDNSVYSFVNNGGDNVVSLTAYNKFWAKGFFKNLARAVLYGVVVVASGIVGYAIGSSIGGLAGGIAGAAIGVSYAITWADSWLWPEEIGEELPEPIGKNENRNIKRSYSYASYQL